MRRYKSLFIGSVLILAVFGGACGGAYHPTEAGFMPDDSRPAIQMQGNCTGDVNPGETKPCVPPPGVPLY